MLRRTARRPIERPGRLYDLRTARMNTAADLVQRSVHETLAYYSFPDIHWQKIRTNLRSNGSCGRSDGEPAWWVHSPIASPAILLPHGSDTSPERHGRQNAT
jgi:hypothetical protein